LTSDIGLFRELCERGEQLVGLHLLRERPPTSASYPIRGDDRIQQICYALDACPARSGQPRRRVWINARQYFEGLAPEVWRFQIGGYQVCRKWLNDRKGRRLSCADRSCYGQIVGAIAETIRLMQEIDAVIDQHGGWPIGVGP